MIYLEDLNFRNHPNKLKYQVIVESIISNIENGTIKNLEVLPSINEFSKTYSISRDTVEKAYKILKRRNFIASRRGKNTFVTSKENQGIFKILFIVSELNSYNLKTFNAFVDRIGKDHQVKLEIYNGEEEKLLNILIKYQFKDFYYLLIPDFNRKNTENQFLLKEIQKNLNKIPRKKIIFLENNDYFGNGNFQQIYQDFEKDIYEVLQNEFKVISKYSKLILQIPKTFDTHSRYFKIQNGFKRFCNDFSLDFEIKYSISDKQKIEEDNLYIVVEDDDLVKIIDLFYSKNVEMGTDAGLISYNDSSLKRLLGISVFSMDFEQIGLLASDMIKNDKTLMLRNSCKLISRKSL